MGSSTEVKVLSDPMPSGEMVAAPGAAAFKLALPPPIEAATAATLVAVQEWWKNIEPLLRELQVQVMLQLKPFLEASTLGVQRLQLELHPHTEPAMAALIEWKQKLEPHTVSVLASVQAAADAVRIKAYEPALAAVIAAIASLVAHAAATARIVQQKAIEGYVAAEPWLLAQKAAMGPLLEEAQKTALMHAQASIVALQAWQKQLEPLAHEQMARALIFTQEHSRVLTARAAEEYKAKLEPHLLSIKGQIEQHEVYQRVAPHVAAATETVVIKSKEAWEFSQPHLKIVAAKSQEAWTLFQPKLQELKEWSVIELQKLEPHVHTAGEALKAWSLQMLDCLCMPFAKAIKFGEADSPDYPPVVVSAPQTARPVD